MSEKPPEDSDDDPISPEIVERLRNRGVDINNLNTGKIADGLLRGRFLDNPIKNIPDGEAFLTELANLDLKETDQSFETDRSLGGTIAIEAWNSQYTRLLVELLESVPEVWQVFHNAENEKTKREEAMRLILIFLKRMKTGEDIPRDIFIDFLSDLKKFLPTVH